MGHGHGPHDPYKVPSADIYKLEDAPELVKYQQRLEKAGLKDPWIRNYIWCYNKKKYGSRLSRALRMAVTGMPTGIAAFALTLAIENALGIDWHAHHHAEGHDDKSH